MPYKDLILKRIDKKTKGVDKRTKFKTSSMENNVTG